MKNRRLFDGLAKKLDILLEEHTENFIAQRPCLWREEIFDYENLSGKIRENEFAIKKTIEAIDQAMGKEIPKEPPRPIQSSIFSMAD